MKTKTLLAALVLSAAAATAQAVPIQFTQTFSNVTLNDFGYPTGFASGLQPAGDWIFSGIVDSEAVDLAPQYDDIGMFAATNITLTQAGLGLDRVGITNLHFLYFVPDRAGFDSNVNFGTVWTRTVTTPNHFLNARTLAEYLALAPSAPVTHIEDGFGPQGIGFALEDGRRIYGWGSAVGGSVTVSYPTSSVPEPGTFSLMLVGTALLLTQRRRKTAGA